MHGVSQEFSGTLSAICSNRGHTVAIRKGFFDAAYWVFWVSQVALVVKNWPVSAGDLRDAGLISGSGRSPGGGHGNPLQYSYLENPMDRGPWRATVQGATELITTKGTWRACTGCPPL